VAALAFLLWHQEPAWLLSGALGSQYREHGRTT
jgi:hypothetical protein